MPRMLPQKIELTIFTSLGQKVRKLVSILLIISVILFLLDIFRLKKQCKLEENQVNYTENGKIDALKQDYDIFWNCIASYILANIYTSLFTSLITIIGIELVLQNETIQKIKEIFQATQATQHIKAFYPHKLDYSQLIIEKISNLKPSDEVKLLGLSEEVRIIQDITVKTIVEKIEAKCSFQILLLHPKSSLLKCLENTGFENKNEALYGNIYEILSELGKQLKNIEKSEKNNLGTIEIRLYKDVFSPICYFSGNEMELIWMYFMNSKGLEYPAFDILDKELIHEAQQHFKNLWEKAGEDTNNQNRTNQNSLIYFQFQEGKVKTNHLNKLRDECLPSNQSQINP